MKEQKYMKLALELAKQGEGNVNPNPLVGAVVVQNGLVVGKGYHHRFGDAHAEVYALEEAGKFSEGATLYITLEPCSHYGKTPPCVKKIVETGIRRCVIAMQDPNPLVSGRGIRILREAGIEVEVGLLEEEAKELNRVFLKYIQAKIPFLFLKCGITLDGKLATRNYQSKWITNAIAREKVQYWRHKFMAIMVGIHTVLEDNPSLNARIEGGNNPYRIVVDPYLEIKEDATLLQWKDKRAVIITSSLERENAKRKKLEKKGVRFIELEGREFSFSHMLEKIGQLGIDSVLLEGGGKLISTAFQENVIDGGEVFIAPKLLGDRDAVSILSGFSPAKIEDAIHLSNVRIHQYGDNCSMEFYR